MKAQIFVAGFSAVLAALFFGLARFSQAERREEEPDCQLGYDGDLFI